MKRIFASVLIAASLLMAGIAKSDVFVVTNKVLAAVGYSTNCLLGGGTISYMVFTPQLTNTNTFVYMYDAPATNIVWIQRHTNAAVVPVTITSIYTNRMASIDGTVVTITNIYTGVTQSITIDAGSTNYYPMLGLWEFPTNTATYTVEFPIAFTRGLFFSNSGPCAITIVYQSKR